MGLDKFHQFLSKVTRLLLRPSSLLACSILTFVFLFIRARAFALIDFPIPAIHPDSQSYTAKALEIFNGSWPHFGDRSPLIPLAIVLAQSIHDSVWSFIVLQNVCAFSASIVLIHTIFQIKPALGLWTGFTMGMYMAGAVSIEHDTAVLSESLYTSMLILWTAFLVRALISSKRAIDWIMCSFFQALVIFAKPAGLYLVVVYGCILGFLWLNRYPKQVRLSYGSPFAVLLLLLATYNFSREGVFRLTASTSTEITFITNLFWEPDPIYPPEINKAIRLVESRRHTRISSEDLELLRTSWNLTRIYPLWLAGHQYHGHMAIEQATQTLGRAESERWLYRLSRDTIRKHPQLFFKHFATMMFKYFQSIKVDDYAPDYIWNRVNTLYVNKTYSQSKGGGLAEMAKEFADPSSLPRFVSIQNGRVRLDPRPSLEWYASIRAFRIEWFGRTIWYQLLLLSFGLSAFVLVKRRGRSQGAFVTFALTSAVVGAAMIVSLVEFSQPRYSYPLEWIYFLSPVLSFLALRKEVASELRDSPIPVLVSMPSGTQFTA